ncbi:hypothetical protein M6I34_15140 [Burkholderiaceae bacterium FT117]|uniref:hypothetical protein n=1 Tax=Zeimonas sediminis TaxID=2944268 RepID=UPI002342E3CA|nr:hypothetical protein [Zeimonas sediminis]MCM5571853.1 hypothetical protein [Zeimonas sediminis]
MSSIEVIDSTDANDPDTGARRPAGLPSDVPERIAAIVGLLARLGRSAVPPEVLAAQLETLRSALLPAVDATLERVEVRQMPYGAEAWRLFTDATSALRALRTLYRLADSRMGREARQVPGDADAKAAPAGARTLPVAAPELPAASLPLLRALDLQSRVLAALLVHRIDPLAADWNELCVLGRRARSAGLLDFAVPDPLPPFRPVTARALFTYPLLLRLADLPARSRDEIRLVARLAAPVSRQLGFRVDAGTSKPNPLGPIVALTPAWSVRLDSHRVPGVLAGQLEAARGDAAGAAVPAALKAELQACWGPGRDWPSDGSAPASDAVHADPDARADSGACADAADAPRISMRFGLPRRDAPAAPGGAPNDRRESGPRAGAAYVFGQWERNTIVRLSMTTDQETAAPPESDPLAGAEPVRCLARRPGRIEIERLAMLPPAPPGGLVALQVEEATGWPSLLLGRVAAIEQLPDPAYARLRAHRLAVEPWPGTASLVGLRFGSARFFEDAWLLRGGAGARDELVTAPGLAAPGGRAVLRDGEREVPIRFTRAIGSGPGYERIGFAVDDRV